MDFLREVACLQHDSHSVLFPHCSQPLITGRMQIAPDCRVLKARFSFRFAPHITVLPDSAEKDLIHDEFLSFGLRMIDKYPSG